MLKFRFKVSTEAGQVRVGHIEAVSVDVARQILQNKRFTVLELDEARPTVSTSRRARAAYRPHPIEYLEKLESEPSRRNATLGTLAALGLLLAVWYGAPAPGRTEPGKPAALVQNVQLVIVGQAIVPPELRHRATLRFFIPEIPLTVVREYEALVRENGGYRLEYDFESAKVPGAFSVELRVDSRPVDSAERVPFSGKPRLGAAPLLKVNR